MPRRSLVLTETKARWHQPLIERSALTKITEIREPDGGSIYLLLEKP